MNPILHKKNPSSEGMIHRLLSTCFLLVFASGVAWAQEDEDQIKVLKSDLSNIPAELSEEKTSITGQKDLALRDAPATVSVITEEDIVRSGARDLMDVLRLVPGFEFGTDVQGVACLGVRGNSANEGGLLVMVDGMEMTELLYASNQFGSIYPLEQIKKIEVIRGPGSVLYGGFAVYAVINILTKASEDYNGFKVSNFAGNTVNGSPRQNFSASFGGMYEKLSFSITGGMNSANRSDRNYLDTSGREIPLLNSSRLSDRFLSARLKFGKFTLKGLADFYQIESQTNLGPITSKPYLISFSNLNLDLKYDQKFSNSVMFTPYVLVRRQSPWHDQTPLDSSDAEIINPFHAHVIRISGGSNVSITISDSLTVTAGAGFWMDNSEDLKYRADGLMGKFNCFTSYVQSIWRNKFFNISAGTRFDVHSYYAPIFSPRIAINKTIDNHYFKLSYNRSFRTPAIANIINFIDTVGKIKPQLTNYFEFEYGVKASKDLSLSLNLFRINTENNINYQLLENFDGYSNSRFLTGTEGAEIQAIYKNESGLYLNLAWSWYRNSKKQADTTDNLYFVPGTKINLAYPAHKITLNTGIPIYDKLSLNGTLIFLSYRYGYNGASFVSPYSLQNPPTNADFRKYDPVFQANLSLDWRDVFVKGLNLGLGIFDVFNSRYSLIQPYKSYHLPIPALSREFTFRVSYGLNLE
jgi:outer membrane receptor protein involved in Fe transport